MRRRLKGSPEACWDTLCLPTQSAWESLCRLWLQWVKLICETTEDLSWGHILRAGERGEKDKSEVDRDAEGTLRGRRKNSSESNGHWRQVGGRVTQPMSMPALGSVGRTSGSSQKNPFS